jgi:hypothetical protein
MTLYDLTRPLNVGLGILCLLAVILLFRNYRSDKLRDELFSLRDQVFDFAVGEGLLAHTGYRQLRDVMNGMIRFAHKLSFSRLILSLILERLLVPQNQRVNPTKEWAKSLGDLSKDQRNEILEFHRRMVLVIWKFMIGGIIANPISLLVVMGMFVYRGFQTVGDSLYEILARRAPGMRLLEEQALRTLRFGGY